MRLKFGISLLGLVLMGSSAFADSTYSCTLQIVNSDNELVINQSFVAQNNAGTHAGTGALTFTSADGHSQATVAVDGKWMILNWSKSGVTVANLVFVVENASVEARVAIAYNPQNVEEQASLSCEPNP